MVRESSVNTHPRPMCCLYTPAAKIYIPKHPRGGGRGGPSPQNRARSTPPKRLSKRTVRMHSAAPN